MCDSWVSVSGWIVCACESVGAEGKVPVNLVFRELLFAFVHPWDLERVVATQSRSEYLFFSYLIRWKYLKYDSDSVLCYNVMRLNETVKINMLLCNKMKTWVFFSAPQQWNKMRLCYAWKCVDIYFIRQDVRILRACTSPRKLPAGNCSHFDENKAFPIIISYEFL